MSWADHSSIPLALLGDKVARQYKRHETKNREKQDQQKFHARQDRYLRASWFPLHDALRRFVVEPFDGPWTPA